ncbi:hypothetical protein ACLI4Q_15235 [Natrialbaceae archaeon A-CW1-1]
MNSLLALLPFIGAGVGMAAAYGVTHRPFNKRIHFVKRENLQSQLDDLDIEVEGSETCLECGRQIQQNNIGAIVQHEGDYKAVCDKTICLDTYDIN